MPTPPTDSPLRVLVVDDEKNIRQTLGLFLEKLGCQAHLASSQRGRARSARAPADGPGVSGSAARHRARRRGDPEAAGALRPTLPIVVFTAYATVETAVETLQRGAWDYLPKPYTPDQIRQLVDRARERRGLSQRVADLEHQLAQRRRPSWSCRRESPADAARSTT